MMRTQVGSACPRCEGRLRDTESGDIVCWQCGYADYEVTVPVTSHALLGNARRFILRFRGDDPNLRERTVQVEFRRRVGRGEVSIRLALDVWCPFCGSKMAWKSVSGRRKNNLLERFYCPDGHRINVVIGERDFYWLMTPPKSPERRRCWCHWPDEWEEAHGGASRRANH